MTLRHPHAATEITSVPSESVDQTLCLAMDQIQDDVMDELGRPWPELVDDHDTFVSVLVPGLLAEGGAVWSDGRGHQCAIGELRSSFGDRVRW